MTESQDTILTINDNEKPFPADIIDKNRCITYPLFDRYSRIYENVVNEIILIGAKKSNEKRLLSFDISLTKEGNTATAYINQVIKHKSGKHTNSIVYVEDLSDLKSEAQAVILRRLFSNYMCDYLAIDCKGVGLSIVDLLMTYVYDQATDTEYAPLTCANNEEIAKRCTIANAKEAIWVVSGSAAFNTECLLLLRDSLKKNNIRLLISDSDAEECLNQPCLYNWLDKSAKTKFLLSYCRIDALEKTLTKIEFEIKNGSIRIKEEPTIQKDIFMSLAYSIYLSKELARQ